MKTLDVLLLMIQGKMPCMFQMITGLYCPGCGGTRAVKALLAGDVVKSFLYHPLVVYGALVAIWFAIAYLLYWKTKNPRYRLSFDPIYVNIGAVIIVLNFLVKNYLLMVHGIDVLTMLG